jgi:hypothetical protein
MALLAGGLLAAVAQPAAAEEVPNIAGEWRWESANRKVIITQDGAEVSGRAVRRDGTVAFQLSGSVDATGQATLKVFYDRSDMARGTPDNAFKEAVRLTGDKAHPGLLPAKSTVDLKYGADKDQLVGHMLKLDITIHHDKADGANSDKDYVKFDRETPVDTTLTRTYASRCAATMGDIPAFSCKSGEPLPIKVNKADQSRPVDKCDKPVQLPLSADENKPSQCVPGSRLVRIENPGHPDVETLAICRKYNVSFSTEESVFHDIAMVSYDTKSGQTCFFQSKTGKPIDTAKLDPSGKIPSPTADNAGKIWEEKSDDTTTRGKTGPGGVRCNACHSAGPFLWSPYLGQAKNIDVGRWGQATQDDPYDSNFAKMFGQEAHTFRFKNSCTECHRIGDGSNCSSFVPRYTTSPDEKFRTNSKNLWMPVPIEYEDDKRPKDNDTLVTDLAKDYKSALKDISDCCDHPLDPKCHRTAQPPP